MEIVYYLSKKENIFFDKSVIFKTEIARMFIDYMKLDVNRDLVLTANLLCNCKKINNAQVIEKIKSYALEGAAYLEQLGFEKRFCKICEEVNRYSQSEPREKESDILELVDQFGGMVLDRPERKGFDIDEAIVLIEYRNLKNVNNRYLNVFKDFIEFMEKLELQDSTTITPIRKLRNLYYETTDIVDFIKNVTQDYSIKVNKLVEVENHKKLIEMMEENDDPNRTLFSIKTVNKLVEEALSENL